MGQADCVAGLIFTLKTEGQVNVARQAVHLFFAEFGFHPLGRGADEREINGEGMMLGTGFAVEQR